MPCDASPTMSETRIDWPSDDAGDSQTRDLRTCDSEVSQQATQAPRSRLRPEGVPWRSCPLLTGSQNGHTKANLRYATTWNGNYLNVIALI
ncbi:hypothetical protein BKA56DRAFT_602831 [Ilyonectria sp. MPI-CAGE-AT-0026]|nr:hypothetical protein BKA56DRAFT_602831 [Ilyonectria sp. MPI-CAGE-AT-0026]